MTLRYTHFNMEIFKLLRINSPNNNLLCDFMHDMQQKASDAYG